MEGRKSIRPYALDWQEVRWKIRKRDDGMCLIDPDHDVAPWKHADIHHIDSDRENNVPSNLISLCRSCHAKTEMASEERVVELHTILSELYGYQYEVRL